MKLPSPYVCAVTAILVVILSGVYAAPARAQQFALSISPPLLEIAIKPGKSLLIAYTIANNGDPTIISTDVRSFQPDGQFGSIRHSEEFEGPIRFNLENSAIALKKPLFMQSREAQQFLLRIRVPEGTPEGDYYYTFFAQNDLGRPEEGSTAAQGQAWIGANLLITVTQTGAVDVAGTIGNLTLSPRFTLQLPGGPIHVVESTDIIPVSLIVQNTGRNYVKSQGTLQFSGPFGQKATFDIIPSNVLSQSSRLITATPSAMPIPDTSNTHSPASLYLKGFFMGKYTVQADVQFGDGTAGKKASVTFYAAPIKLIIAAGIALITLSIVIAQLKKNGDQD